MRVYKATLLVNKKVITEEFKSEDNISAYNKAKYMSRNLKERLNEL